MLIILPCWQHPTHRNLAPVWRKPSSHRQVWIIQHNSLILVASRYKSNLRRKFTAKNRIKCTPDQGVDLGNLDLVQRPNGLLDLGLVGALVHDKDKRIVILDFLHGRFCCQRVLDDLVLVQAAAKVQTSNNYT